MFNLEDPIFAGALSEKLLNTNNFTSNCDSLQASLQLYSSAKDNLFEYLAMSSYRKIAKGSAHVPSPPPSAESSGESSTQSIPSTPPSAESSG